MLSHGLDRFDYLVAQSVLHGTLIAALDQINISMKIKNTVCLSLLSLFLKKEQKLVNKLLLKVF